MIVNQSIDDFYFCDLKGKKIAACAEIIHEPPFGNYRDELFAPLFSAGFSYFNSGTILMTCARSALTVLFRLIWT